MTLEQLKDLLSTYGVNEQERNAPVLVNINGVPTPITAGDVEYGTWDEASHQWVGSQSTVVLQTERTG